MSTIQKYSSVSHDYDEYIRDNYLTITIKDMAAKIGRSEFYVRSRMLHMGIVLPKHVSAKRKLENLNVSSRTTKKKEVKTKPTKERVEKFHTYHIGDKIRVTLGTEPGDFRTTYGVVIKAEEKKTPVLKYKDLPALDLREYDRCVMRKEVVFAGDFQIHVERPGKL